MYYFFDESGDFTFPEDRFDSYVQASLICPDSELNAVDRFVSGRQAAWDVQELHATHLADDQLQDVADFINRSPCQLLAHVVDTVLVTTKQIAQFRLDQAATLSRNLEWYRTESTKAIGAPVPEIEQRMDREIKRSGLQAQMNHGEFVQSRFLIELIFDALQKVAAYLLRRSVARGIRGFSLRSRRQAAYQNGRRREIPERRDRAGPSVAGSRKSDAGGALAP
jgi:hypothetical protein